MTNLNHNSSNLQNQTNTNKESQSKTEKKLESQNQTLGIDVNVFKERLLNNLDSNSLQYEILKATPVSVLFYTNYELIDRMKTKGDVNYCGNCEELYIENPGGCYNCENECRYC